MMFFGYPDIVLPGNKELVRRLRLKLDEYRTRLANAQTKSDTYAEDDSRCKIKVLQMLLDNGRVNYDEAKKNLLASNPDIALQRILQRFSNAYGVIRLYAAEEQNMVYGGTGLPI